MLNAEWKCHCVLWLKLICSESSNKIKIPHDKLFWYLWKISILKRYLFGHHFIIYLLASKCFHRNRSNLNQTDLAISAILFYMCLPYICCFLILYPNTMWPPSVGLKLEVGLIQSMLSWLAGGNPTVTSVIGPDGHCAGRHVYCCFVYPSHGPPQRWIKTITSYLSSAADRSEVSLLFACYININ